MKAIICNNCKKVIGLDDIEAIEVLPPQQRQLYPYGKEKLVPSKKKRSRRRSEFALLR
jgi:hypothetical protein